MTDHCSQENWRNWQKVARFARVKSVEGFLRFGPCITATLLDTRMIYIGPKVIRCTRQLAMAIKSDDGEGLSTLEDDEVCKNSNTALKR